MDKRRPPVKLNVKRVIDIVEKLFLVLIAVFTVVAMAQKVRQLVTHPKVELKDLQLMFIDTQEGDPSSLLFESGAIVVMALAVWVVSRLRNDA